ncbi:hypothetical protein A2U01_0031023 [Trifolium medium]|uniref:Uncharacterized protein n=1 Tax=Trifolium medium TaxID=97028 RepID=A0A392PDV6_9FABA|nr:hypothetical protein [Trifolium medium]
MCTTFRRHAYRVYLVTVSHPSKARDFRASIPKKEAQCCFIMLALNKRIKSFNLEVKVSGAALIIWTAKEKEEGCSYSPFGIEVLTTKGFMVGEGLLPRSTFISGYAQQERYVAAFDYLIKMKYDDSPVLLNGNVTHGCVVSICNDRHKIREVLKHVSGWKLKRCHHIQQF